MVETSDEPNLLDRFCSAARKIHASCTRSGAGDQRPAFPVTNESIHTGRNSTHGNQATQNDIRDVLGPPSTTGNNVADKGSPALPPPAPDPDEAGDGGISATLDEGKRPNVAFRLYGTIKDIILSSKLNILLIFVPIGIGMEIAGVNPIIVFTLNAIAIVPLAGLLSYATESVAGEMGDTIGALMNVTFGNAVELIILLVIPLLPLCSYANEI